jgi:2-hydroxychromene-2-carboxylate isomerase
MARRIDYYFSLLSPWSYLGHALFIDVARRHRATIVYKPVTLTEVFAETGGLPLAKRHPVRQAYRETDLRRWRDKRGRMFNLWPRHWPFPAARADRSALAIAASGRDPEAYVRAGFKAVWEREENMTDPATLARILREAGEDADAIVALAGSKAIVEAYERNREDAIAAGVFGAPSYVLDREVFWGQDRIDLLDDCLASGRESYAAVSTT